MKKNKDLPEVKRNILFNKDSIIEYIKDRDFTFDDEEIIQVLMFIEQNIDYAIYDCFWNAIMEVKERS